MTKIDDTELITDLLEVCQELLSLLEGHKDDAPWYRMRHYISACDIIYRAETRIGRRDREGIPREQLDYLGASDR